MDGSRFLGLFRKGKNSIYIPLNKVLINSRVASSDEKGDNFLINDLSRPYTHTSQAGLRSAIGRAPDS